MVLAWKFPFNDSSPELLYKCTKIATSQFIFICNSAETNEHDFGALWLPFSKIKCENKHFNYMLSSNGIKRWPFTHTQKWDTLTISPANSWRRYALVFFSIASYYTIVVHLFDWNALFIPCLNSYTLLFCEYSDLIRNIWRICECVFLFQKRWMCVIWFKSPICGCQKTAHTNSQCNLIIEHFNKRTQF